MTTQRQPLDTPPLDSHRQPITVGARVAYNRKGRIVAGTVRAVRWWAVKYSHGWSGFEYDIRVEAERSTSDFAAGHVTRLTHGHNCLVID
jgi:hypothetical protein